MMHQHLSRCPSSSKTMSGAALGSFPLGRSGSRGAPALQALARHLSTSPSHRHTASLPHHQQGSTIGGEESAASSYSSSPLQRISFSDLSRGDEGTQHCLRLGLRQHGAVLVTEIPGLVDARRKYVSSFLEALATHPNALKRRTATVGVDGALKFEPISVGLKPYHQTSLTAVEQSENQLCLRRTHFVGGDAGKNSSDGTRRSLEKLGLSPSQFPDLDLSGDVSRSSLGNALHDSGDDLACTLFPVASLAVGMLFAGSAERASALVSEASLGRTREGIDKTNLQKSMSVLLGENESDESLLRDDLFCDEFGLLHVQVAASAADEHAAGIDVVVSTQKETLSGDCAILRAGPLFDAPRSRFASIQPAVSFLMSVLPGPEFNEQPKLVSTDRAGWTIDKDDTAVSWVQRAQHLQVLSQINSEIRLAGSERPDVSSVTEFRHGNYDVLLCRTSSIHSTHTLAEKWYRPYVSRSRLFVFLADQQTLGKGQRSNTWSSPVGNLYITFVFQRPPTIPSQFLPNVCVMQALRSFLPESELPELKWINDLFLAGKKICGSLTMFDSFRQESFCVMSVGVNLNLAPVETASCLKDVINSEVDVGNFAKELAKTVATNISLDDGNIISFVRRHLRFMGEEVVILSNDLSQELNRGIFIGIDDYGFALLRTADGKVTKIMDGRMRQSDFLDRGRL